MVKKRAPEDCLTVKTGSDVDEHFTSRMQTKQVIKVKLGGKVYNVSIVKKKVYKRLGNTVFKMIVNENTDMKRKDQ